MEKAIGLVPESIASGSAVPRTRFNPFTGEFRDRQEEAAFRLASWRSARQVARTAFAALTVTSLLCAFVDGAVLGVTSPQFISITIIRLIQLGPLWLLWRQSRSPATIPAMERAVLLNLAWLSFTVFNVTIQVPEFLSYSIGCALIASVVLCAVDVIPARTMLLCWCTWSGANLLACVLTGRLGLFDTIEFLQALITAGFIGRLIARRSNLLTRQHYLAMRDAEAARDALVQSQRELARLAATDSLTGALVRREFLRRAGVEIAQARQINGSLGMLVLDIDHFKSINDRFGHATGDAALVAFVDTVMHCLAEPDCIGRLGGEEFAVLLPNAHPATILLTADRLRQRVAAISIPTDEGELHFTVSIGATLLGAADHDPETMISRADEALYAAKRGGRDQVILADTSSAAAARPDRPGPSAHAA